MLYEPGEHLIEAIEVEAHEQACSKHHHRGLCGLLPVGKVRLGQLAAYLADEAGEAAQPAAVPLDGVAAGLALRLAADERSGVLALALESAVGCAGPLRGQRVSRCSV